MTQPSAEAVRDTLAAVFRQPAFDRSLRQTLWRRFVTWIDSVFERFGAAMGESEALRWGARVALVLLAAAIVGRLLQLLWAHRARLVAGRGGAHGRVAGRAADPLARAREAAAAGRHTDAAHLLYQALLVALAGRERLRLHPSRTVGEYGRELRRRASPSAAAYGRFAREYETVLYDLQWCDQERWDRLHALAIPLVSPDA